MIWLMQAHLFSDHFLLQKEGHTKLENYGYVKKPLRHARWSLCVTKTSIRNPLEQFYLRGTLVVT